METLKKNLIFIIVLAVLIGGGIYWAVSFGEDDTLPSAGEDGSAQPSKYARARADILGIITTLQAIQLDVTVLDDPAFRALSGQPRPPGPEPLGVDRRNPFVPYP